MNYMDTNQVFGQDLSIVGSKNQAIDFIDENEDFQSSISVIQFNESLVNLDMVGDEVLEETFKINRDGLNSLFEEGVKVSLTPDVLKNLN